MVPLAPSPKFHAYDVIVPSGSADVDASNDTVPPTRGFAGENVNAALGPHPAVRAATVHRDRHALEAGLLALGLVEDRLDAQSLAARGLIPVDTTVLRTASAASMLRSEPGAPRRRRHRDQLTFGLVHTWTPSPNVIAPYGVSHVVLRG